jgi:hypothetical protein
MERILEAAKMRLEVKTVGDAAKPTTPTDSVAAALADPSSTEATPIATAGLASPPTQPLDHIPSPSDVPSTDRMAALWTFQGHTLRQLRSGLTTKKRGLPGADTALETSQEVDASAVDADGFPVLHGSCGREKKYARCSVCYFRGVRCNTAHYCACCQRPVCVRPRKYPGEEHPKICWNVLHVDADMIQRVDKRRARKLHAAAAVTTHSKPMESEEEEEEEATLSGEAQTNGESEDAEPQAAKQRKLSDGKTPSASPSPRPLGSPSLAQAVSMSTATKSVDTPA